MDPVALQAFVALHGGTGPDPTAIEYLRRVVLHLLAFAGSAVLVSWLVGVSDGGATFVVGRLRGGDDVDRD